ncbi:DNA polymerase I [Desulfosediminicola flagellatus]|uniref:DNA polymerase I n=1 Tax=Desulfosediminicola flagellatus TaxID=2569541 RepID=UPI0010ACD083|nr:DNA polymerase I [Desulfosediminicola flagellatus]
MKEDVYLIDGSAYIYRAYHAVKPLANSKGAQTNAVFGFINIIRKLIREKAPKFLAVAFDSKGKVFRHEMYPEYKANRPQMPDDLAEQIPHIKEYVSASNILSIEESGIEADDIIASASVSLSALGYNVIIVSGDKDLLQLVNESVSMWDPMKDKLMDIAAVEEKYSVKPEKLLDMFALIGDSADNIPGVPGVGPKTAEKLIAEFGSLDGLYAGVESLKKSKMKDKIIENKELAYLSRDLIALKYDAEIPTDVNDYTLQDGDDEKLAALFSELEFSSFLKEIDTSEKISTEKFTIVNNEAQLESVVAELLQKDTLVVDTETTSLDARTAKLVGVSLCSDPEKAWYIPVGHLNDDGSLQPGQLPESVVRDTLTPLLVAGSVMKVAHNLKYDYTVLKQQWGVELGGQLADTMVAAHLLEVPGRSLKLDDLCFERGIRLTPFKEVVGNDKREDCFAYVGLEEATNYSCEDVYGAIILWNEFQEQLIDKDLDGLFYDLEMPLIPVLAAMEVEGICIDDDILKKLSIEFAAKLEDIEAKIYELSGKPFNINSPRQLGQILFEELELPHGRKTKTGYSTDVKVLEKLAPKHPLPALVLEYRTLTKLQTTYVEKLSSLRDTITGRIHTSFNQAVTATGRLSSTNPNLQNIPIKGEDGHKIRQAFIPAKGCLFISADYSQIDLRVLAHYSQDAALLEAFNGGADIHARTAAQIFGVSPLFITPDMRRIAKSINFGIVYGMSAFGLSSQLNISRKEAQNFIDRYFQHYSGVKQFMGDIVDRAREDGFVTTLLNRRRGVPEIDAKNKMRREFSERMAINTPIQGTAADIIKLAMLKVEAALLKENIPAKMLLQIHDELVFEVPENVIDQATRVIRDAMEGAMELDVPLVVNVEVGKSLAKG